MGHMMHFSGLQDRAALAFKPHLPQRSLPHRCWMQTSPRRKAWTPLCTHRRVFTEILRLGYCLCGIACQPVSTFIFGMAIMAFDPNPFDLMTGSGLNQVMP